MKSTIAIWVLLIFASAPGVADSPRSNVPVVAAGDSGDCYARSVPTEDSGQRGVTTVYKVSMPTDRPIHTYRWYSQSIYISCLDGFPGSPGVVIARMGPWPSGRLATKSDLAVAFYANGKLLNQFSTLEVAGRPGNVSPSVSHYRVFTSVEGFQWQDNAEVHFVATRADGTKVHFAASTGELVREKP